MSVNSFPEPPERTFRPRVIPVLLLKDGLLYKTHRFKDAKYIGDPLVAVKIFNDKSADEIAILDIGATPEGRGPDFELVERIATECFMPMAYGGGVSTLEHARRLVGIGAEKVIVCTHALAKPVLVSSIADAIGSQSTVVCLDVKRDLLGRRRVMGRGGRDRTSGDPVALARRMEQAGAGELIVQSVDRDGTLSGYDLALVRSVAEAVEIPVIALGGAAREEDFQAAIHHGASAASAGAMFVFQGPHRAVLITYADERRLEALLG